MRDWRASRGRALRERSSESRGWVLGLRIVLARKGFRVTRRLFVGWVRLLRVM